MATKTKPRISLSDYLALEREHDERHEYFDGELFAMSGASRRHNLIVMNLVRELSLHLKELPCEVYSNDMRVKVDMTGLYTYPDVVIACETPAFEDEQVDTLLNPTVVIEVLSESTEGYDWGKKFEHYRKLPSLRAYLLVAQDAFHVEQYVRQEPGQWLLTEATGPEATLAVEAVGAVLELAEVYDKVSFDEDNDG